MLPFRTADGRLAGFRRRSLALAAQPAVVVLALSGCSSDDATDDDTAIGPEVTREQLGDEWPLTVDGGTVICEAVNARTDAIVFRADDGTTYALDGAALAFTDYPSIAEVQAVDEFSTAVSTERLVEIGEAQCDDASAAG